MVDFEGLLLWRGGKPANDTRLHAGHQNVIAKLLPTLLGVVTDRDQPPRKLGAANSIMDDVGKVG